MSASDSASVNRRVVLKRRPSGLPALEDFAIDSQAVREPAEGEVVVRHSHLGLAPAARIRMSGAASYADPTPLGEPVYGQALGTVIESRHADFEVGDVVMSISGGWQSWSVADGAQLQKLPKDVQGSLYLGLMGSSGFTAYVGLLDVGRARPGETVVVSAASGAVGGVVVDLARILGCRVVGVAGGPEKCAYVRDALDADACIDRHSGDFVASLTEACPRGVDVYFDNTGGRVRDAVWPLMRDFGRVVVCGQISAYNDVDVGGGPGWFSLLTRRLNVQGFLLRDHAHRREAFDADMNRWLSEGRLHAREHVWRGLDQAPAAFVAMLRGDNFGKTIVALDD